MVEFAAKFSEKVHIVPIESLRVAGSPRSTGEDVEHIRMLADVVAELPPVIVHRPTMRVIDGVHRLRAAQLRGRDEIEVRFFDGDEGEAFVLAVRTNVAHGMPLSLADRKSAAARIVASHPHWSDRMIAGTAGLSAATVARIRLGCIQTEPTSRIGHDGRVRPVNSMERRRLARSLLVAEPTLSLREVARRVGISPETARAVRAGLRRGEPPATPPPPAEPLPDAAVALRHLRGDPALRFTEAGRELLRLLDVRAVTAERWAVIAASLPPYCRDTVTRLALDCARTWHTFAQQVQHTTASEAS
jgi:ParB-like chromosome segregation protein Spo0J